MLASYEVDTSVNYGGTSQAFYLATTSGAGVASNVQVTIAPGQTVPVQPVLQQADGSYIGTVQTQTGNPMIAFTASGNTLWMGPNDTPQIATSGGGVIGASGTTYDQNGNVTGQTSNMPTQSWTGNSYQLGSVDQVAATLLVDATSFWPRTFGNPSTISTASQRFQGKIHTFKLNQTATIDISDAIKTAQNIWSRNSNGAITLLWDKIVDGNINPCVTPSCTPSDAGDLLYINSNDPNVQWQKLQYYYQMFPNRTGINLVEIYYLLTDKVQAAALNALLTQPGTFGPFGSGNIIVVRGDSSSVLTRTLGLPPNYILAHEIGTCLDCLTLWIRKI